MLQTIQGREVYVVEFDTVPDLPITWNTPEEEPYARALHIAIEGGLITEGGKYGIDVETSEGPKPIFNIFHIIE
jgi:hypothetical protein